jgi:lipid II:glycine glycyltransferase (peptidoglycan interpeptide bridge formation enzyme)
VRNFCQEQGVWELGVQSFCSDATDIPSLPGELNRRTRYEYVIDLTSPELFRRMSQNHRRNINRARKAGLVVHRTREAKAAQAHLALMQASMQRRKNRGEDVPLPDDTRFFEALLRAEAAELFQATAQEQVFSSIMIIKSCSSAYYQSAGTLPAGMTMGASAFLIAEVARILQQEELCLFNLGGAGVDEQGLRRFKQGFGSREVRLETARFSMVSPIKRKFQHAAKRLHKTFLSSNVGKT